MISNLRLVVTQSKFTINKAKLFVNYLGLIKVNIFLLRIRDSSMFSHKGYSIRFKIRKLTLEPLKCKKRHASHNVPLQSKQFLYKNIFPITYIYIKSSPG